MVLQHYPHSGLCSLASKQATITSTKRETSDLAICPVALALSRCHLFGEDAVSFPFVSFGGVEAMFRGSLAERAALSQGSHAI